MGRLLKREVDKIKKMQDQGYTQKETAEAVGRGIRTVRKYWYRNASQASASLEERLSAIEESQKSMSELLVLVCLTQDHEVLWCPACETYSLQLGVDWTWGCSECGYEVGPVPVR